MDFDKEFFIPLGRTDARVRARHGGRPLDAFAVTLELRVEGKWRAIRLIDNHLGTCHMHRFEGYAKGEPEPFLPGIPAHEAMPEAIRSMVQHAESIIQSWTAR